MLKRFCIVLIPCKLKKKIFMGTYKFWNCHGWKSTYMCVVNLCVVNLFMGNDKSMDYISEIVMN
jgi:hypothetical protein